MPLKRGSSDTIISQNIRELHGGNTYARTKRKFGKKRADRQAVAIAMHEAGRTIVGAHKPMMPQSAMKMENKPAMMKKKKKMMMKKKDMMM